MPLIARKATLGSYLLTVLMTPFCVMMAALFLHRLKLAAIGIVFLICIWFGTPIDWSDLLTLHNLVLMLVTIVSFWGLAFVLTIFDHFRYQGWELLNDRDAEKLAVEFVASLMNRDMEAARQFCSTASRLRSSPLEFERRAQGVVDKLGDAESIMELDEPGRFRLPILQGAANSLNAAADAQTSAVALVLLNGTRGGATAKSIPTVRLRLQRDSGAWSIIDFEATTTALCQSQ